MLKYSCFVMKTKSIQDGCATRSLATRRYAYGDDGHTGGSVGRHERIL